MSVLSFSHAAARQARLDIAREAGIWLFIALVDCHVHGAGKLRNLLAAPGFRSLSDLTFQSTALSARAELISGIEAFRPARSASCRSLSKFSNSARSRRPPA